MSYSYNQLNDRLEFVTSNGKTVSYNYETNGSIKKITSASGTAYNFAYDEFGRSTQISIGNNVLSHTAYRDNNSSLISRFTYGNGVYKDYAYDYLFDADGRLVQIVQEPASMIPTKQETYWFMIHYGE